MKHLRTILQTLPTVLALCLYGLAGAAGTLPGAALEAVVICGETGAETIWVDPAGNPAQKPHDCGKCLDCMIFSTPLPVSATAVPVPPATWTRGARPAPDGLHPLAARLSALARGPWPAGRRPAGRPFARARRRGAGPAPAPRHT